MHNTPTPKQEELPSKAQLFRASILACLSAVLIGISIFLPAEYGEDPTGIGSYLGLTEMGEIKQQLAAEAHADAEANKTSDDTSFLLDPSGWLISSAHAQETWTDEIEFTLGPDEWFEIKATMKSGEHLSFAWTAAGGRINFDLHGHAGGQNVSYEKGRGKRSGEGSFTTPFAGDHGWFWRNRDDTAVTVTLKLRGEYSAIVRSD
ncbi:transmembrane anchor protein [Polycladidibacter stylochi]|uniref:transmembrane anchor protein n=1 Tax=Polycladidibacter stylochi TaxID=1807766 RepID=UPI0008370954|nr:transmembrane anchor protein [Pseudovibrio stylochi]